MKCAGFNMKLWQREKGHRKRLGRRRNRKKLLGFDQGILHTREGHGTVCELSTNCGLDHFTKTQILLFIYQKPILQLVDNYTYGTIAFPCIKSSLV